MRYDILDDEQNYLLSSLLNLTRKRVRIWDCTEYNPLSFLSSEEDDGRKTACITQIFVFHAEIKQVNFDLELSEDIDIETGKGDIFISLEKQSPVDYAKIDIALSFERTYEDCPIEKMKEQFGSHIVTQFSDILIPYALETETVSSTFLWAEFNPEKNTPRKIKENRIYQLSKELFQSHRFLDFHKCVLDPLYREKLLSE